MHEFSLVACLLENVCDAVAEHDTMPVTRIHVRVGELCQVVPALFHTAFDAATAGTRLEEARLTLEVVPARVRCVECHIAFHPEDVFWVCPVCGHPGGEVVEGDDLILERIELGVHEESEASYAD